MEGDIIVNNDLKRSIILDNYQFPSNRKIPNDDSYIKINTNNESCIDNIDLYVKLENDIIDFPLIIGTSYDNEVILDAVRQQIAKKKISK